jgi:hypothetical protein
LFIIASRPVLAERANKMMVNNLEAREMLDSAKQQSQDDGRARAHLQALPLTGRTFCR